MHRSLDFTPVDDEVIVTRILVQLHHSIDEYFPNAPPASSRFAKTAFAGYDEPTLTQTAPAEALREAAEAARLEEEALVGNAETQRGIFGSPTSRRQTMIGLAIFLIVTLIAYFATAR